VQVLNPVSFNFDNQIVLVGYAAANNILPGSTLSVNLYWRAMVSMTEDYTVFVHLVDANGNIIAQKDDQPQAGAYPTSFWNAGETIADDYLLAIPGNVAPGEYKIEIGVYRANDDTRLTVQGGGDHITLATVRLPQ
jgi:hypothetical protein